MIGKLSLDRLDEGEQPTCDLCGTVMRTVEGGYRCGGCGWELDIPWIERPTAGDELPDIRGG